MINLSRILNMTPVEPYAIRPPTPKSRKTKLVFITSRGKMYSTWEWEHNNKEVEEQWAVLAEDMDRMAIFPDEFIKRTSNWIWWFYSNVLPFEVPDD